VSTMRSSQAPFLPTTFHIGAAQLGAVGIRVNPLYRFQGEADIGSLELAPGLQITDN